MAKATVVFSDGSKNLAHNLDDLRERWLLRRQEWNLVAAPHERELDELPNYASMSLKEMTVAFDKLANDRDNLQNKLTQIKESARRSYDLKGSDTLDARRYHAQRSLLVAELNYKILARRHLASVLKISQQQERDARRLSKAERARTELEQQDRRALWDEYLQDPDLRIDLLVRAHRLIKKLITENKLTVSPEDKEVKEELYRWIFALGEGVNDEYDRGQRARLGDDNHEQ